MSTKPPASVAEFPAESLEKLAYNIVKIPTQEPNDRNRLGYCLWGWLSERRGTLLQAICAAGTRSSLTPEEIYNIIQKRLQEKGIKIVFSAHIVHRRGFCVKIQMTKDKSQTNNKLKIPISI